MKKSVLDQKSLTEAFEELKISTKHIKLIWRYVIQNQVEEFVQIPGIPKRALELLNRDFVITTSKVVSRTDNQDKSTTKLLIELQSGQRVETVIMRYGDVALSSFPIEEKEKLFQDGEYKFKSNKRATLCVSSQVGCAMGCTFCGI
jgi:adenine C2-methylase RlmN of 23S rRNA A2503 and tRNA A37